MMLMSIFSQIRGLYRVQAGVPGRVPRICLIAGLVVLITGIIFYRALKSE